VELIQTGSQPFKCWILALASNSAGKYLLVICFNSSPCSKKSMYHIDVPKTRSHVQGLAKVTENENEN
jgi:hypothetical protein